MIWLVLVVILICLDWIIGRWFQFQKNQSQSWMTTIQESDVYIDGNSLFSAIYQDIEQATKRIDIQFFIIRNDKVSNRLYALLARKQSEGVQVRLLTDWIGSIRFRSKWLKHKMAFRKTNPPAFPFLYRLQQRNHRKTLIIDDNIAYVGGFNLGDEYLGKDLQLGAWRDYHVRVTGEIVKVLQTAFTIDWEQQIQDTMHANNGDVEVLTTEGYTFEKRLLHYIHHCQHSIEIGSPYFIPSSKVKKALLDALNRGVKVTILYPDKADHLLTKAASLSYLKQLKSHHATIRLYKKGFFHGKVIFIDEETCIFGTSNFDRRSCELNQELNFIFTCQQPLYAKLNQAFWQDVSISKPLTDGWLQHQPVHLRLLSRLTMPIRQWL